MASNSLVRDADGSSSQRFSSRMCAPRRSPYTELPEIGTPDDQVTTVIDTEAHLAARDAAIAVHRSPIVALRRATGRPRRAFLGHEHLIRVNPPWPDGPQEHDLQGLLRSAE